MAERRTPEGRHHATGPASAAAWGLGLVLYPLGARRVSRASLVRRWYARAGANLSVEYDDWFDPAAVGVVDALIGLGELGPALERHVDARARAGFSMSDTAADLGSLVAAAPARLRLRLDALDLARLIALAWPEPAVTIASEIPALSGLAAKVRDACGRYTTRIANASGPTLIVIEGDPDDRDRLAVATVRWVEELFPAAEILGAVAPGRFLAIVHSHAPVPDPAQLLHVVLQSSPGGEAAAVHSQPWPADVADALALVSGLAVAGPREGERDPGPRDGGVVVPMPARGAAAARIERLARDTRSWAAGGIAAAVAFALMLTGGVGGNRGPAPHAAARLPLAAPPPATPSPGAAANATTGSALSLVAGGASVTSLPPGSGPGGPPKTPAAASRTLTPASGRDEADDDDRSPSPNPPLASQPVAEPPGLGDVDTRVRKLLLLIQQSTGPDGANNVAPGLVKILTGKPAK